MSRSFHTSQFLGFFLLILSLMVTGYSRVPAAQLWIPVGGPQGEARPAISVVSSDQRLVELEVDVPGLYREMVSTPGGEYPRLSIPEGGFMTEIGRPQLPIVLRWVEIPAGASAELEVVGVEEVTFSLEQLGIHRAIVPVQRPVPKIPGAREVALFEMDRNFYARDQWFPQMNAELAGIEETRGHRMVVLKLFPVRYNPLQEKVSISRRLHLRVHLRGSDLEETNRRLRRWDNPIIDNSLVKVVLDHDRYLEKDKPPLPIGYLIVVHDSFHDQILPLAQWKEQKGFDVTVTRLSEISPGSATGIKAYILDAYQNWEVPPTYVLLVGDTGYIPTFSGSSSSTETDLPYGDMEGSYFPELLVGRFSVSSTSEASAAVDKTLDYEKTDLATLDWLDDAVFMASYDNYQISEGTHNWVISTYMNPNGYTSYKIYARLGGGTSDISSNINAGRGIANYSGHGNQTSWSNPGFNIGNIDNLTNTDMYPFVISNACLTSDLGYGECYGEHWLNVAGKGAIAHWGSSNYTYWDEDDILEKRMYRAIFDDQIYTFAGFTNQAKWYTYQEYGGGGLSRYYYECYILLGDPALELPTAIPAVLTVDHPATVPLELLSDVTVNVTRGGSPVEAALVCAMQESGIHEVGYTDVSGQAILPLKPATADTILVTVTAHNCQPHQGIMLPVGDVPPAAVNDLQVSLANTALMLSWSAVTTDTLANPKTVTGYVIYRGTNPYFEPSPASSLAITGDTQYLDLTAAVGDTALEHYYTILAVDEVGRKSEPSNDVGEFDIWTTNLDPPEPPVSK